jgi:deoxyadenosine/deoxycytidine kinase
MTGQHLFVAVSGNIGAGKSSLARLPGEHFHWKPYYESVDNNPYLADFYADMPRRSFHLQVYFLSNRFKGHKEIVESNESVFRTGRFTRMRKFSPEIYMPSVE